MAKLLMTGFDVCPSPGSHANTLPYLLNIQNDLLASLDTRALLRNLKGFRISYFQIDCRHYLHRMD